MVGDIIEIALEMCTSAAGFVIGLILVVAVTIFYFNMKSGCELQCSPNAFKYKNEMCLCQESDKWIVKGME